MVYQPDRARIQARDAVNSHQLSEARFAHRQLTSHTSCVPRILEVLTLLVFSSPIPGAKKAYFLPTKLNKVYLHGDDYLQVCVI